MTELSRRLVIAGLATLPACADAIAAQTQKPASQIAQDIGDMLVLGFRGHTVQSESANNLAVHIAAGRAAGACFIKGNVGTRENVLALTTLFASSAKTVPLIMIDHEGGSVQRLTARNGFTDLPSAQSVATTLSPDQARALYAKAGSELAVAGFTVNLAPVVDLYYADSSDIGARGRAFSADVTQIVTYATACIDGFASAGIQCALKHFPGGRKRPRRQSSRTCRSFARIDPEGSGAIPRDHRQWPRRYHHEQPFPPRYD